MPQSLCPRCSAESDPDERVCSAICSCNFYQQNKLRRGPCEHILAVRLTANKSKLRR